MRNVFIPASNVWSCTVTAQLHPWQRFHTCQLLAFGPKGKSTLEHRWGPFVEEDELDREPSKPIHEILVT